MRARLLRPRRLQQLQQRCLFEHQKPCKRARYSTVERALRQPRLQPPLARLQLPMTALLQLLRNALRRLRRLPAQFHGLVFPQLRRSKPSRRRMAPSLVRRCRIRRGLPRLATSARDRKK